MKIIFTNNTIINDKKRITFSTKKKNNKVFVTFSNEASHWSYNEFKLKKEDNPKCKKCKYKVVCKKPKRVNKYQKNNRMIKLINSGLRKRENKKFKCYV